MIHRARFMRYMYPLFVGLVYFFLYIPIILLIIFSFNSDSLACGWQGFTTKWYEELWQDTEVWQALQNSLIVASGSVLLSVTMGTLFVFYAKKRYLHASMGLFYASLAVPEIVLAVGLLSFFYFFSVHLGLTTLIVAHTVIGLGYLMPLLYTRYVEIDKRIIEASYDLGATREQTFVRIVLPLLFPALFTGSLLIFIISFDDFLLSFFCAGATAQTLPMYIFALIRSGASPVVNALSTMLLVISSLLMALFFCVRSVKTDVLS